MLRIVWSTFVRRGGRALALVAAIGVATATFTVLTGASETGRLQVSGVVSKNFRSAYDVLVRPRGVADPLEASQSLVRRDFLAGVSGGITMEQYHHIAALPGVQVAAPIAILGATNSKVYVPIPLQDRLTGSNNVFGVDSVWTTDRGLSRISAPRQMLVRTKTGLACPKPPPASGPFNYVEPLDCSTAADDARRAGLYSTRDGWSAIDTWTFPFVVAAIDPVAEARLTGMDTAMVSGRFLRPSDEATRSDVPVIAASTTSTDLQQAVTVTRLLGTNAPLTLTQVARLRTSRGPTVLTTTITARAAYAQLLAQLATRDPLNGISSVSSLFTTTPTRFDHSGTGVLRPRPVINPVGVWASSYYGDGWGQATPGSDDVAFRRLVPHQWHNGHDPVSFHSVGVFDVSRLPGYDPLSRVSLGTYFDPVLAAGDARTNTLLHGQGLAPSGAITSYAQAPPLLLTTLDAAYALTADGRYANTQAQAAAPISAIRVRVAGVTGPDAVSRERVRQVAQAIAAIGLQVDITIGSSPSPRTIALPAGNHGRPALTLTEYWVKKGVAVAILLAVDKKSALLFGLILAVCALVVANAANASVRARRTELAVLSCLGWPARRLFALVLTETTLLGLVAGVLGSLAAWPLSRAAGVAFNAQRAEIAIPAAVALALLAGLGAAVTAARAHPAAAVAIPVAQVRRARPLRGVTTMAATNTARTPGRSLLGATSLAVGTAGLTVLLGLTFAFRGVLVGSLLGDAVAVQTRAVDFYAVAAMIVLGALGVADVLYLNIRETAAEIATLRAIGWSETTITRLVAIEGVIIGAVGALAGALLGLAATVTLATTITTPLLGAAATAAIASTALAVAAAVLIARSTRALPTAALLAGE